MTTPDNVTAPCAAGARLERDLSKRLESDIRFLWGKIEEQNRLIIKTIQDMQKDFRESSDKWNDSLAKSHDKRDQHISEMQRQIVEIRHLAESKKVLLTSLAATSATLAFALAIAVMKGCA